MAKAILEFDLNNEEDAFDFKLKSRTNDMYGFLFELFYNTRKNIEWELETKDKDDKFDTLSLVFEEIHRLANEYNLNSIIE